VDTERRRILLRQVVLLATLSVRTIPWVPLLVAVVLGSIALAVASRAPQPPPDGNLAVVGALLATWFASLLGDRSAAVADATPPHLFVRRAIRLAVCLPILLTLWAGALAVSSGGAHAPTLSFLFTAQLLVALGAAAVALRVVDPGREVLWAAGGLMMVFIALPFGLGFDVSPIPATDGWWLHSGRWLTLGGSAAFVFVLASLDPAGRGLRGIASARVVAAPGMAR
jgi:hypothetical protein